MNILSLFDGMSCGQQALTNLGIKDYTYYSSEIDKYAIQVTQANFPNTIQIGDVTKVTMGENGVLFYPNQKYGWQCGTNTKFDLLLGGSPCQGFSFAGKQLAFDDPRSKLFFEYVRILKEVKPKYFLLENVKMKKEFQDVISEHLFGIPPVIINSALLTAQNRVRLYWVGELQPDGSYKQVKIEQPQDKGILLKDILESEVDEKYYLLNEQISKIQNKINDLHSEGSAIIDIYNKKVKKDNKCPTLTDPCNNNLRLLERPHGYFKGGIHEEKSPTIRTQVNGNTLVIQEATKKGFIEVNPGDCFDYTHPNSKTRRGRSMKEKSNCMTAGNFEFMNFDGYRIRKLTPTECERLQGVKDGYTSCVSNSQRYKMLGNGWTIPIIEHILKNFIFNNS